MAGRIRSIKPELLEDAVTAGLSDSAFRLFVAMILLADDYGNVRAEDKWLEGQVYWSAVPEKSVRDSCEELESLMRFYTVRGQAYAHINGWSKHQKVQHPGKPRVPGPDQADPEPPNGGSHETLTKVPESRTPDLRSPTSIPPIITTANESLAKPSAIKPETKPKRGMRLPEGWTPSPGSYAEVLRKTGQSEAEALAVLEEFRDFWCGVPGQKGCKLDWDATFRNRLREVAGRKKMRSSGRFPSSPPPRRTYPEFTFEPGELPSERRGSLRKLGGV